MWLILTIKVFLGMLELVIERFAVCRSAVHGRLSVDGQYVCDTLEYEPCCLQEGSYSLSLEYVASENRKMLVVGDDSHGMVGDTACKVQDVPCMLVAINGPFTLKGGCISVGECHHLGYILHCAEVLDLLFERVRISLSRGRKARLHIRRAKRFVDAG